MHTGERPYEQAARGQCLQAKERRLRGNQLGLCLVVLALQLPGRWHFVTAVQADEYRMEPANTAELVYWVFTSYHAFPLAILPGALQGPILQMGSLSLGDEDLPLTGRKWQGGVRS